MKHSLVIGNSIGRDEKNRGVHMNLVKLLTEKTRAALEQTSNAVRDKIEYVLQKPSLSIEELATFIKTHPNATLDTKTYLGITYSFYNLHIEDLTFYLETKGKTSDYILELLIQDQKKPIFDYFSYKQKGSTQKHVKLNNAVNEAVK
jgi:hypothetical protein